MAMFEKLGKNTAMFEKRAKNTGMFEKLGKNTAMFEKRDLPHFVKIHCHFIH
jgi:hypothetical protein